MKIGREIRPPSSTVGTNHSHSKPLYPNVFVVYYPTSQWVLLLANNGNKAKMSAGMS